MDFKSRLLTTAFTLPLLTSLSLAPSYAFDITDAQTAPFDTGTTTGDLNNDGAHSLSSDGSITIDGTPQSNEEAAILIDSSGQDIVIDGDIIIRDRNDDGPTTTALENAIGIKLKSDLPSGITLRINSQTNIIIDEVRGPDYDGDDDGLPDNNDSDEDGIIEGSSALGTDTHTRIGLWVDGSTTNPSNENIENIISELGSTIRIDGNGARGAFIDRELDGNFDFSTAVHNGSLGGILGDDAVGVLVNEDIDGYYRQRGAIDVRGEDSVGIEIDSDATIGGGMMIDAHINATGYSLIVSGTNGGPSHGRDETDLDADEAAANTNERRRGGAAVDIAGDLSGGLIIGGKANRILTRAESDELAEIVEDARDDDGDRIDISGGSVRSKPVHFDGNRPQHFTGQSRDGTVSLTSYGEADNTATLKITGNVGLTDGGSVETLLDLIDDDAEVDSDGVSDPNIYTRGSAGLKQFYYSYGLMNRGSIEANGLYDGYKADAVLLHDDVDGNAVISGGVYNAGTISATAYNENATTIEFGDIELTDGLRNDGSVFLNEGEISASVSTHAGADADLADDSNTATAILLTNGVTFGVASGQEGTFLNRGFINSSSAYFDVDGDGSDGKNAVAIDASVLSGNFNVTQELLKDDKLLDAGNSVNNATNPYLGGGDTDIDRAGDTDGDGNIIGDEVIDTRDISAPSISGDVNFGDGDNVFTVSAGTVNGNISFGDGDDRLTLSNEMADDADDNYTAPITTVTGRITKGANELDVTIGDRAQLHLVAQEGDDDTETEGVNISNLTLTGSGNLKFTIDPDNLDNEVLNVVGTVDLADNAKLTPALTSLMSAGSLETVELMTYTTLTKNNADINSYLADETPFIYDVSLSDNETDTISANFRIKSVADLGINQTEGAALAAVIDHFSKEENAVLESRLTALSDEEDFNSAYRQLLPHYSDGTAQQLAVLAEASTGAVSQHLQLVAAGGRRGGDGWVQQFGDFRKQDSAADNGTVSGTSYGIAFGYDFPLGNIEAMGLYTQINFTAVNQKTSPINEVKSDGTAFGAYIADSLGPLRFEVNAAYGMHDLESDRFVSFGYAERASAAWNATSTSASARFAYPIFEDTHLLRLEAGIDYFNLAHDDYQETGVSIGNLEMQVKDGESEKTSQFIGLRGARRAGGGDPVSIVWEPNYYLGYRSVSDETPYTATANFVGSSETFTLENFAESEDAIDVGFGVAAHNDYFAFEFNYRGQFADGVETHGGGVSVRLLF